MVKVVALLLLTGFTRATLVTDPVPLTEYYSRTLKDYKKLKWNEITRENSAPITRVKNLQDEKFKDLVRKAYPFVVDDCADKAELKDAPCSDYGRRFPKEHMKAEYTKGQGHINLEDPSWYSVQKPTAKAPKHISLGKPLSGPYIWHVKDETVNKATKPAIMKQFPVPYFLNGSTLNSNEARDSFEFWFVLENGGSQAHADAYCETTISLQLRGKKTWRMGAFPNISNAFQQSAFHDATIYKHEDLWQPESEFDVEAGQCIVFPMGYIHETYIHEGSGGDDGCSVATTFQFQDPQPVFQWKNFMMRWGLSHYAREEPCMERMEPYVMLGRQTGGKSVPEGKLEEVCKKSFKDADSDGDGKVSLAELEKVHAKNRERMPWTNMKDKKVHQEAKKEKIKWMAEDTLLYHDDNGDGSVTLDEYLNSAKKFMAVVRRTEMIKKTKNRKKLYEQEKLWIREHLCTSDDCHYLEQLDKDFGSKKSKGKSKNEL